MTGIFTDQMHRNVQLPMPPKRIVSLVPSQTELLQALGLEDEVVGITKFCIHPVTWFRTKTRVGGTKQLDLEKIRALRPELIIANKEENTKEQLEILMREFPVWISDIRTLEEALEMIRAVGRITGKKERSDEIALEISRRFDALRPLKKPRTSAYFIWRDPWMVAGGDTFIGAMLLRCGLSNHFGQLARYPSVDLAGLANAKEPLILLSSEPYPFRAQHVEEIKKSVPGSDILLVDGTFFSWYGSRLLEAPGYLNQLLDTIRNLE